MINGLSSVSGEFKVNGYGVCFAGKTWKFLTLEQSLFVCQDGLLYKYSVSS